MKCQLYPKSIAIVEFKPKICTCDNPSNDFS